MRLEDIIIGTILAFLGAVVIAHLGGPIWASALAFFIIGGIFID